MILARLRQRFTLRGALEAVSRLLSVRVIRGEDGTPYLSKHLLLGKDGEFAPGWRLYLHRFHRSDMGTELHNHPWEWAISWILVGGYREHARVYRVVPIRHSGGLLTLQPAVQIRKWLPGDVNVLLADTFHRVDMLDGECWTLFLTGPKTHSWGFLNDSGIFTPWRDAMKQRGIPEQWQPETAAARGES